MDVTTEVSPRLADFQAMLDQTFCARSEDAEFDTDLIEVKALTANEQQENFSLLFRAPEDAPIKQGIHELSKGDGTHLSIFLVPVSKDEKGVYFEAVFNNFVKS
jgi:hypothetical protein